MSEKLKPCPFCGGDAEFKEDIYVQDGDKGSYAKVSCSRCLACISDGGQWFDQESHDLMKNSVIEDWQRRADKELEKVTMFLNRLHKAVDKAVMIVEEWL